MAPVEGSFPHRAHVTSEDRPDSSLTLRMTPLLRATLQFTRMPALRAFTLAFTPAMLSEAKHLVRAGEATGTTLRMSVTAARAEMRSQRIVQRRLAHGKEVLQRYIGV